MKRKKEERKKKKVNEKKKKERKKEKKRNKQERKKKTSKIQIAIPITHLSFCIFDDMLQRWSERHARTEEELTVVKHAATHAVHETRVQIILPRAFRFLVANEILLLVQELAGLETVQQPLQSHNVTPVLNRTEQFATAFQRHSGNQMRTDFRVFDCLCTQSIDLLEYKQKRKNN
jgi:hypothetical protein